MSAPSYMLTASSDGFGTWAHTNLTRLCDSPRLSWFFPRAFMDNAAVVLNNGQLHSNTSRVVLACKIKLVTMCCPQLQRNKFHVFHIPDRLAN